jgi:hypothetical protein
VLSEVEKLKLPDMVIPDNVLESGKKSFTVPVPSRPGVDWPKILKSNSTRILAETCACVLSQ